MRKRLTIALIALLTVFTVGTFGNAFLLRLPLLDAFYFTVVTLSTVGYGEIYPVTPESKLFTSILILIGIGILAIALETIVEGVTRRSVMEILKPKAPSRKLLEKHFIICGSGRIGQIIIDELKRTGEKFVVVESNPEVARELSEKGVPVIEGSPLEEETLRKAGIERAKGLATVLDQDSDNVFITITAKTLNPNIYVVAKVSNREVMDKVYKVGADRVVAPELEGGKIMARALTSPHMVEVLETLALTRDVEIAHFRIDETSELTHKTLTESKLEEESGAKIFAICRREGVEVTPSPESTLESGCILLAIGRRDQIKRLEELLAGKAERFKRL
ncbi:MAG: potassium channel protein [Candidatus Hecatellales archaeon]|nr:MAG: potassium channel protein [Candidatus Hecatellales archaeon]